MKTTTWGCLMLALSSPAAAQTAAQSIPVRVDCGDGQSLNRALSRMNKQLPATVSVSGNCAEYVHVVGFENLTLKGLRGATLVQPSTSPGPLANGVLLIESSRSITVDGLNVQAGTNVTGIAIGNGSSDIRLRNLTVVGGGEGIAVFENSQVSLASVTGRDAGFAPLAIYDSSDVHLEHSLFEDSTGTPWHVGITMGASHLTVYDTVIRNMQVGIDAAAGSIVDTVDSSVYSPLGGPTTITIECPAGTCYNGVALHSGASLNMGNAGLAINGVGQPWGGNTAGVLVADGSTLTAINSNLAITGGPGQGITVVNNSHATLAGSSVMGSGHGGLVAANLSSIDVANGNGTIFNLTLIGGNGVDLFCDATSAITGSSSFAGVPTSQCAKVQGPEAFLP